MAPTSDASTGDPLVVVEVLGGLGNQMFQYAAAFALARRTRARVKLDVRRVELRGMRRLELEGWNAPVEIASEAEISIARRDAWPRKVLRRASRSIGRPITDIYVEPSFHYDEQVRTLVPPVYLHGYFQSPLYFEGYEKELRELFQLRRPLSSQGERARELIQAAAVPVAVHVRRGDFARRPATQAVHGLLGREYYDHALAIVDALAGSAASIFVFSDEPDEAARMFASRPRTTVVQTAADTPAEDIALMSFCCHIVMANSSFSWWAAWLGDAPGKSVVAPRLWLARDQMRSRSVVDLYPNGWILI